MKIQGKTVLITGGSAGIGLESAKQFLSKGADVIITGRDQAKLDKAEKKYPKLKTIRSDVSDADEVAQLLNLVNEMGGIDILYNNAGVGTESLSLAKANNRHFSDAAYEMDINYLGVIRLIDLFMPMLQSRIDTAIINTTSILSYLPAIMVPTYSASKAALRFYTESLRKHLELAGSVVKVFELQPPLVDTDMTVGFDQPKMPAEAVVKALIAGVEKDQFTIRPGQAGALYKLNRFFPKKAFNMLNPDKLGQYLK